MRAASRHVVATLLVVSLATATLAAQKPDVLAWKADPKNAASYASVQKRYADLIETWGYESLFTNLRDELKASRRWSTGDAVFRNLLAAFDEIVMRFSGLDARIAAAPDRAAKEAVINDFLNTRPTGLFQEVDEKWFSGKAYEVTAPQIEMLPLPQFDDFLHRVNTAERLLTDMRKPNRLVAQKAIADAAERWHQYVFDGRSQYPWEIALNGVTTAVRSDIQHPPGRQWILLHPELGVEVGTAGAGAANLTAKESVLIQAVGHVWYRWPASTDKDPRWWGFSATVALREELRPGVGFTVHYGKILNAGMLWHDVDRDGNPFNDTPYVQTGLDLFRLAKKRLPPGLANRLQDDTVRAEQLP